MERYRDLNLSFSFNSTVLTLIGFVIAKQSFTLNASVSLSVMAYELPVGRDFIFLSVYIIFESAWYSANICE